MSADYIPRSVIHATARRLCWLDNCDWRYDPAEYQHEHYRGKARLALRDALREYERQGYRLVRDDEASA